MPQHRFNVKKTFHHVSGLLMLNDSIQTKQPHPPWPPSSVCWRWMVSDIKKLLKPDQTQTHDEVWAAGGQHAEGTRHRSSSVPLKRLFWGLKSSVVFLRVFTVWRTAEMIVHLVLTWTKDKNRTAQRFLCRFSPESFFTAASVFVILQRIHWFLPGSSQLLFRPETTKDRPSCTKTSGKPSSFLPSGFPSVFSRNVDTQIIV